MSYATLADMIDAFGERELIQVTGGDVSINESRMAKALAAADSRIDPALRSAGLALPFSDPLLTAIACDVARFHLYEDAPPDTVEKRYATARSDLRMIATRQLQLSADPGANHNAGSPQVSSPGRVFTNDLLDGY